MEDIEISNRERSKIYLDISRTVNKILFIQRYYNPIINNLSILILNYNHLILYFT